MSDQQKDPHAVALGRRGGRAKAARMTSAERREHMRAIAQRKRPGSRAGGKRPGAGRKPGSTSTIPHSPATEN